jgi:hypothetical protein
MNDPYRPPATAPAAPYAYPPSGPSPEVSEGAIEALRQTRPWVTLMSVVCFILAGLMVIAAFIMFAAGAVAGAVTAKMPFPMAALGIVYLPFAFLYVYPGMKLWTYASAIGRLLTSRATPDLDSALLQQKSFWKYAGIMTLLCIVAYALILVGFMFVGMAGAMHGASGS